MSKLPEEPFESLARDWRQALERFRANGGTECRLGCDCPMSEAIAAVERFVVIVEGFERGELIPGGLPYPQRPRAQKG
jgi:hypothetical protein